MSRGKKNTKASPKVETVLARRSRFRLVIIGMCDGKSGKQIAEYKWQTALQQQWKLIPVHRDAQVVFGLLVTITSVRGAFLARESPWKPGTGVVVGEVSITNRKAIMRGHACDYCLRDPYFSSKHPPAPPLKLQHWGSVACFLDLVDRKALGVLLFMHTRTTRTHAFKVAAVRQGKS